MNVLKTLFGTSLIAACALAQMELEQKLDGSSKSLVDNDSPKDGPAPLGLLPCANGAFSGPLYESQSAHDKLDQLWDEVTANIGPKPQNWVAMKSLFTRDMNLTFDFIGDELPYTRIKVNHSQGVASRVKWVDLGHHDYTGLYRGESDGLMRLSEGNFLVPEADGLTPTVAFKFTRDGMHSVNHVANTGWGPSGSYNFFANDFKTHIGKFSNVCERQTIERKFEEVTPHVGSVGLAEFSRAKQDGSLVSNMYFPADLKFVPHKRVATRFPNSGDYGLNGKMTPFWKQLTTIPEGKIFTVWAKEHADPCHSDGSSEIFEQDVQFDKVEDEDITIDGEGRKLLTKPWVHIADIYQTSDLVTSWFCDECLFFKHERLDLDFQERPELEKATNCTYGNRSNPWGTTPINPFPGDQPTAKAWVRGQIHDHDCPFAWLLNWPFTPIF